MRASSVSLGGFRSVLSACRVLGDSIFWYMRGKSTDQWSNEAWTGRWRWSAAPSRNATMSRRHDLRDLDVIEFVETVGVAVARSQNEIASEPMPAQFLH